MRRGYKARPHDLDQVMTLNPEVVEIHASSEDLEKEIQGEFSVPLVVHCPEYAGSDLLDISSPDEKVRLKALAIYQKTIEKTRVWGRRFRGAPKLVLHPGGWSNEPLNRLEKNIRYDAFATSIRAMNKVGVDVMVENMPPYAWFWGGEWNCSIFLDPTECRDYSSGLGIGFCFDICHAYLYCNTVPESMNLLKFAQIVRPVLAHIHFSDGKGVNGEGLAFGEGDLPIKDVLRYLHHLPVAWVSERWQGHKDGMKGFKEDWIKMDEFLKEIQSTNGHKAV